MSDKGPSTIPEYQKHEKKKKKEKRLVQVQINALK